MIIGRKNEIAILRDAYESELPRHIIHLSGRQYPIDVLARLWLARRVPNLSRITPMRRICSFTDFYCVLFDFMRLSGAMIITDYLLLAVIPRRIGANAIRSKSNIKW